MNFSKEIEMAQRAREDQHWIEASRILGGVIISAAMENQWTDVGIAISHKLIIYKRRFEATTQAGWLDLMRADAEIIIRLSEHHNLANELKSVGFLRLGDYNLMTGDARAAVRNYKKALSLLPSSEDARFAEYLAHYTLAQVFLGLHKQFEMFGKALQILDDAKKYSPSFELRNEQRLIIRSGILLNAAKAARFIPQHRNKTKTLLKQAKTDASQLADQYHNANRLVQVKNLEKTLKIQV
jgi:tetratricopeptide (TPR) repeat protein